MDNDNDGDDDDNDDDDVDDDDDDGGLFFSLYVMCYKKSYKANINA